MHGLGNDYVYIQCMDGCIEEPNKIAQVVSDRHFGIGSDGLVLIMSSRKADFRMRMFNADGTEAQMCGNAIRCVGKYVYDNSFTRRLNITIETLAGVKTLKMFTQNGKVCLVEVDMGEPVLNSYDIPVISKCDMLISMPVKTDIGTYSITCVSMGNPHAIVYVEDLKDFPLEAVGKAIENSSIFPQKSNAEFVKIIDKNCLEMRVWERGTGETLACGTGACATLVASVLNDVSNRKAEVRLRGGSLDIEWREDNNHVYMTGPATHVFDGEINV